MQRSCVSHGVKSMSCEAHQCSLREEPRPDSVLWRVVLTNIAPESYVVADFMEDVLSGGRGDLGAPRPSGAVNLYANQLGR